MLTLTLSLGQIQLFLLIFLRVSALLFTLPPFEHQSVPVLLKVALAFSISLMLFPLLEVSDIRYVNHLVLFIMSALMEILSGVLIGLSISLVFAGIQLAGQLIGFQMGFAISTIFDPLTGTQGSITAQFYYLTAMLVFLTIDAHHLLIRAVVDSFWIAPVFGGGFEVSIFQFLLEISAAMFSIAVKIGAPVIAALVLSTFALGLIARLVPQMNVYFVAMPLQIFIGLLFIGISLSYFTGYLENLLIEAAENVLRLLKR